MLSLIHSDIKSKIWFYADWKLENSDNSGFYKNIQIILIKQNNAETSERFE